MNIDNMPVAIHIAKKSESIAVYRYLTDFKPSFIHSYINGHVWGCYLTKAGNIAYQDNNGKSFYNILKKK